jgi:hypothetical protein
MCANVFAKPLAVATKGKAVITLHSDPCAVKNIANLPFRATWIDGEKQYEGCWAATDYDVVVSYWSDNTIALIPFADLRKAGEAI